jgi:7-cyano-7-deazaguanine reductase
MVDLLEEIKSWEPLNKMEDATEDIYLERIQKSYKVKLPNYSLVRIQYIGRKEVIEYKTEELIALCPITFLPDIYKLSIKFIPDIFLPELKSLKFYFMDYRELPISHEHLASKIYVEFLEQIKPKKLYLYLETNIRGGITTNIEMGERL